MPWHDRGANVIWSHTDFAFGEINNRNINGEFDATIIEVAFHDNLSDARLLRDPKVRNWSSRASYRAVVKYMNEFDGVPLNFLPEPPRNARAVANAEGDVVVSWDLPQSSAGSLPPTSYVVYRSTNGYGFGNPVFVEGATTTSVALSDLPTDTELYFRVAARNPGGESFPSDTVGVRVSSAPDTKRVLFVNGYSRFERFINIRQTPQAHNYRPPGHNNNTGTIDRVIPRSVNSFDYVVQHGRAIAAAGMAFDSCRSSSVINGQVNLDDYDAVVWAFGQESTVQRTFTVGAQNRIAAYLNNNGSLCVSGSDIAFDLDRPSGPSAGDRAFLHNYLRASYVTADSQTYSVAPVSGRLFQGRPSTSFDSGPAGIYPVRSPDIIAPVGAGAQMALQYAGGAGGASAVQYDGSEGGGRVVFMSFPFETIINPAHREQYMASVLEFLTAPLEDQPPSIVTQPVAQTAIEGVDVVLSVDASGFPAPTVQWQLNGVDIPGATDPILNLSPALPSDSGVYRAIISNSSGSIISDEVIVTIHPIPGRPRFISVNTNDGALFEATLLGTPNTWFLIETSPDLASWEPLTILPLESTPIAFVDSGATDLERRFYRARATSVASFTNFASRSDGTGAMFRNPSFSGTTSPHIATGGGLPDSVTVTSSFPDGLESSRVLHASWSFASGTSNPWLRLTTFSSPSLPNPFSNPIVDFTQVIRMDVYVDRPIYLALGLRETNSSGSIGQDGGADGPIEFLGGRTDNTQTPPRGKLILPGTWTTVHFFLPFEPVRNFHEGNGILESTTGKGVLEHLTIVPADGPGIYNLYLGDFRSVPLSE